MFRTRFKPAGRVSIAMDPANKKTKSSFKDECDVNKIMARAIRSGSLPPKTRPDQYLDCLSALSYQDALEVVMAAENSFLALPAQVRQECANDPAIFLERMQDPKWAVERKLAVARDLPPAQPPEAPQGAPKAPEGPGPTQPGASDPVAK